MRIAGQIGASIKIRAFQSRPSALATTESATDISRAGEYLRRAMGQLLEAAMAAAFHCQQVEANCPGFQ
jgi:hypothetical protein